MNQFFYRLKESFLGSDGKLSSRKLTAFLHICLMTISTVVLWSKVSEDLVILYCIFGHGLFALLLLGIITVNNIITFTKARYDK